MPAFYCQPSKLVPVDHKDGYIFPWSHYEGAWILCQKGNSSGSDGTGVHHY